MKLIGVFLFALTLLAPGSFAALEEARMSATSGVVASIDNATSSLTVKVNGPSGDAHELTLVVTPDSKIVKSGTAVPLTELKQGDKVTVTYRAEDGKNVVVNIGVESRG